MSFFFLFPDTSGGGGGGQPVDPATVVNPIQVADEPARLALLNPGDVQFGDIVYQQDNQTWWRLEGADPSDPNSWREHFLDQNILLPAGFVAEFVQSTADGDNVLLLRVTDTNINPNPVYEVMLTQPSIDLVALPQSFELDYENGEGWV